MPRVTFLSLFIVISFFFSCQNEEETPLQPNVILIMVDDLGSADLGSYGNIDIATPHLDQLAREGVRFTQAYSGNPVCAPARSTLLTGLHSGQTPVRGNTGGIPLPDSTVTLAKLFKKANYATGGFGKWGLGEVGTEGVPERQGFDTFFGYYHQIHAHSYYPEYLYRNSKKVELSGEAGSATRYSSYRIVDEMAQFIRAQAGKSFFCYAPWPAPHHAFEIPADDPAVALYAEKDWSDDRKAYAAMVSSLDRQVGEIMALLHELNLAERTIILFCSDNGGDRTFADYQPNGTLRGYKRDLYEGGIRVPLIVWAPNCITQPDTCAVPVYFPDVMPTLAELCGFGPTLPAQLNGRSFAPALTQDNWGPQNRFLYWEYPGYNWSEGRYEDRLFSQAIRYKQWKMIRKGRDQEWELYDLNNDPSETDNISAYHPGKMQRFREWIRDTRTKMPPQIEPERVDGKPFR